MPSEQATRADEFEAPFVQSAQAVTAEEGAITLHGLAPATLMFSDRPERIVGHLSANPRLEGEDLSYNVSVLDGDMPATTGPCSLFIDPVGRPPSPVSVMGVRRRSRRRARRF